MDVFIIKKTYLFIPGNLIPFTQKGNKSLKACNTQKLKYTIKFAKNENISINGLTYFIPDSIFT